MQALGYDIKVFGFFQKLCSVGVLIKGPHLLKKC
jgi:hypothetical protein